MATLIGERLGRAIDRTGLTRREVARRAGMQESTISDIITGKTPSPFFITIEKIVRAAGLTWSEVFDEPQIRLSAEDTRLAGQFHALLGRLIDNDAAQKEVSRPTMRGFDVLHDRARGAYSDVESLPNEPIPDAYQRLGANRVFRVHCDAMIDDGILDGALIYVHATVDEGRADGEIVIARLNEGHYLRRLDLRGGETLLRAANKRYEPMRIDRSRERFTLIGIVRMLR